MRLCIPGVDPKVTEEHTGCLLPNKKYLLIGLEYFHTEGKYHAAKKLPFIFFRWRSVSPDFYTANKRIKLSVMVDWSRHHVRLPRQRRKGLVIQVPDRRCFTNETQAAILNKTFGKVSPISWASWVPAVLRTSNR